MCSASRPQWIFNKGHNKKGQMKEFCHAKLINHEQISGQFLVWTANRRAQLTVTFWKLSKQFQYTHDQNMICRLWLHVSITYVYARHTILIYVLNADASNPVYIFSAAPAYMLLLLPRCFLPIEAPTEPPSAIETNTIIYLLYLAGGEWKREGWTWNAASRKHHTHFIQKYKLRGIRYCVLPNAKHNGASQSNNSKGASPEKEEQITVCHAQSMAVSKANIYPNMCLTKGARMRNKRKWRTNKITDWHGVRSMAARVLSMYREFQGMAYILQFAVF